MAIIETHSGDAIDRRTSRSICDAVAERLQQYLGVQSLSPSENLDRLVEELRRNDGEAESGTASQDRSAHFFR